MTLFMEETYFRDQVAAVTGAGGTLCSEIAEDLASRGAKVALIGRTEEKLRAVADRIGTTGGTCMICPGDVTDETAMAAIEAEIFRKWGACRFLVNGAGGNNIRAMTENSAFGPSDISGEPMGKSYGFFDLDMTAFLDVLRINTLGTVIACRVFGRRMAQAGKGAILNFASMNSYRPLSRVPAYAMSKAAVVNFTQWLAAYLAPAGIRVNAVAPGFFVNERSRKYLCAPDGGLSARGENVMHHTPMGKFGVARDLTGCVRWLLDDRNASFVTGITVPVDGGFLSSTGI